MQVRTGKGMGASTMLGQLAAVGTAANAVPSLANIDPPRMFQFQVRYIF